MKIFLNIITRKANYWTMVCPDQTEIKKKEIKQKKFNATPTNILNISENVPVSWGIPNGK